MALLFPAPDDPGEPRADIDYRIESFTLTSTNRSVAPVDISDSISASGMTLSVDQSSPEEFTVSVLDPDRKLLRGDLLTGWLWGTNADNRDEAHWVLDGRTISAKLDDLDLQLVKASKQGDIVTLTFEQAAVLRLKAHSGARHVFRDAGVTRAQFVKMLADAAGVQTYIPELNVRQPVAAPPPSAQPTATQKRSRQQRGLDPSAHLTIKHKKATDTQRRMLEEGLDEGEKQNAPDLAMLAMIVAAIGESTVSTVVNKQGYGGMLQGQVRTGGHYFKATDTAREAHYFFRGGKGYQGGGAIHMARANPGLSPGAIANTVEGGNAGAHFYDIWGGEARAILSAYRPGFSSGGTLTTEVVKPYAFARHKRESSWAAIQRLAEEVQWRAFIRKGVLWYVSEEYLFKSKPQIAVREPRFAESEGLATNGVTSVDFDVDLGAKDLVAEVTISALASLWTALPGMVISVRGTGPADGRWIVGSVDKTDLRIEAMDATITCHKPLPTKPEPANERETLSVDISGGKVHSAEISHMTPKQVIDTFVLPVGARHHLRTPLGAALTPHNVKVANDNHPNTTQDGNLSDHAGPPQTRWAVDMSNGVRTPQERACAEELARLFDIPWHYPSGGLRNHTAHGFRFQLIHLNYPLHDTHVHFGVHKV